MGKLLAEDLPALRLLMSEDLYRVHEPEPANAPAPAVPDSAPADPEEEAPAFAYLGENNKYFLILVNDPGHQHLNTADRDVLLKILQAKGMELRDVAIMNTRNLKGVTFARLKNFFVPSRIVFFGLSAEQFGIPALGTNTPGSFEGVKLLTTFNFAEMQADINKKKAFWQVMKNF